ncbi:periplasmic protease [Glaciecola sp. KUL10]|nr:periplasmic protease [Glaciecola sp. KUL10]
MYDYTRETCLVAQTTTQESLASLITVEELKEDEFEATEDKGKLVFSKRSEIPPSCKDDRLITENGPVQTLEHIIHNFNDYYPFFEARGIFDWEQRTTTARELVNDQTSDDELLEIIINLLHGLDDGHVTLSASNGFEFSPASLEGTIDGILQDGFTNQSEISDFNSYISAQLQRMFEIKKSYFDDDSFKMAGGENQDTFQWATIGNGVIGYIEVLSMGGISDTSEEDDLSASEDLMDRILTDLAHTEALIINVMINGGGDLAVADAIANRFSQEKVTVTSYQATGYDYSNSPEVSQRIEREMEPTERVSFARPVATIAGPNTYSAAEHFLLSMRALNHPVCFIGEKSNGILSAVLDKKLPNNDVRLGLSNMITFDHTGQMFEAVGIPVDIEATTFELVDSNSQRNVAMDAAITALGFGYMVDQSEPAHDCSLTDARLRFETTAPQ